MMPAPIPLTIRKQSEVKCKNRTGILADASVERGFPIDWRPLPNHVGAPKI